MNKRTYLLAALALGLVLAGCGLSGSTPAPTPSDTTRPTVSLSASSTSVTAAGNLTLTANAADNVGVTRVEFFDGTTKLGEDTAAPYEQTVSLAAANNGTKSYTARASDAAGNSQTSAAVTVAVAIPTGPADTTRPTLVSTTALTNTSVRLVFSEPIVGGNLPANFRITTDLTDSLGISAATVSGGGSTVTLTTAPQAANQPYIIIVSNVTDLAGNSIGPVGQQCSTGTLCASFTGVGP